MLPPNVQSNAAEILVSPQSITSTRSPVFAFYVPASKSPTSAENFECRLAVEDFADHTSLPETVSIIGVVEQNKHSIKTPTQHNRTDIYQGDISGKLSYGPNGGLNIASEVLG